ARAAPPCLAFSCWVAPRRCLVRITRQRTLSASRVRPSMAGHRNIRDACRPACPAQPPILSRDRLRNDQSQALAALGDVAGLPRAQAASEALDIALHLDDPAVAHAHQVDAAHRVETMRSPDQPPFDLAAISARDDAFRLEIDAPRGGNPRPKR